MFQSRKKIFVLVNTGCLLLGQRPRPVIVGWHRPLSPNLYFNISRKSFISSVPLQNCHFKRHINLFHLQTLMNACPVTVSALNSVSTLQAPIFADAVLDSFWIQMAELAQVNLNPLSSGWRHLLKAACGCEWQHMIAVAMNLTTKRLIIHEAESTHKYHHKHPLESFRNP